MTTPRTIVLLNAKSRDGQAGQRQRDIEAAFAGHQYPVTVQLTEDRIDTATQQAIRKGYRIIVAAGGDGTIRAIAAVVAQSDGVVLGVLPMGTFNHFAKDAGIPIDLTAAARIIAHGKTQQIDCASVSGRLFMNSAALGLHPLFVRRRQFYQSRIGKWLAIPVALVQAFARYRTWPLTLQINNQRTTHQTALVIIGNNDYQVEQLGLLNRQDLAGGLLYVYILNSQTRLQFLHLAFRIFLGRTDNLTYFKAYSADSCTLEINQTVQLTMDGELTALKPPLEFRALPGRLTVLVPE